MENWTPDQWLAFLGGAVALLGTLAGTITTVILQLRGNAKTEAARMISADNNEKVTAVVAQVHNIADAVPGASTGPTDALVTKAGGA
jgi:hypothetical protein